MASQMLGEVQVAFPLVHVRMAGNGVPEAGKVPLAQGVCHRNETILLNFFVHEAMPHDWFAPLKISLRVI